MKRAAYLAALLALVAVGSANAEIIFTATLTHDQETLPQGAQPLTTSTGAPRPLSYGEATLVLNDAEDALTMTVTIYNIDVTGAQTADANDNLIAAHIHAAAVPGVNASVVWGFFGTPDNDNNPDNLVVTPFVSDVGGTFVSIWNLPEGNGGTTLTAQLPNILAGLSYLNFHTVQFSGGEIRGQILAVPEPGTWLLLLLGMGMILAAGRRSLRG